MQLRVKVVSLILIIITLLVDLHETNVTGTSDYNVSPVTNIITSNIARSKVIFETFLKKILDLMITDFPESKLKKYCRIVYKQLRFSEYRDVRKIAKHFKYLSRMYQDDLLKELEFYRRELDKTTEHRAAFFEAINEAFTLREHMLFSDYLYDLRNYGTEDKLYIHEETKKLINNVIIENILKLSAKTQNDVVKKFRKALKEFNTEY